MNNIIFLALLGLFIVVAWVIQGTALYFLTSKLGFPGVGIRKTLKVMFLLVVVGFVSKLVFGLISTALADSVALGILSLIASFGASVAVVHFQYKERFARSALVVAVVVALSAAAAVTIRVSFAQAFRIPTPAMAPALEREDFVFVSKFAYRGSEPERGDIVVFEYPRDRNLDYVKRVMGLPGETIEIRDQVLFVDGRKVEDPWGVFINEGGPPSRSSRLDNFGPVVVPEGEYFMLGDNRNKSVDSRLFGYVSRELLIGKVILCYWPVSRWGGIQ